MAGNPRLDDLRKRLEKEPGSRLFAQLAEELRKEGELEESIQVARDGLKKHPNYPSARMTLGRALLDTGDLAAAKTEFELVLKGAPDNILASRYLAECLEGLGDLEGATGRYKLTLQLAPGDKQAASRLQAVEKQLQGTRGAAAAPAAAATAAPVAAPPGAVRAAEAAPTTAAATSTAPAPQPAATAPEAEAAPEPAEPPPIPLVAADEAFELERPYEAGSAAPSPAAEPAAAPAPAEAVGSAPPAGGAEFEFDFGSAPTIPFQVTPLDAEEGREAAAATAAPAETVAPPAAREVEPPSPAGMGGADLVSTTLAELYFKQGHIDKARDVYRQLVEREPTNDRVRQRLDELTDLEERAVSPASAPPAPAPAAIPAASAAQAPIAETATAAPASAEAAARVADATPVGGGARAARRQTLERTIARLEGFLSAIRRSAP